MENKKDFTKVAKAIDDFMKQHPEAKNLVLGESHTEELEHYEMLSDPKVNSVLQSHGIHTLAIESPAQFQEHVNKVMWDNVDPKSFANTIVQQYVTLVGDKEEDLGGVRESYEGQGSLIQAQTKYGNNVVFFDNPDMDLKSRDTLVMTANQHEEAAYEIASRKAHKELESTAKLMQDAGMDMSKDNLLRTVGMLKGRALNEDPTAKAELQAFSDLRINDKDEQLRADHIKEQAIGGAVVLAGSAHGSSFNDLDGRLNAARLVIVQNMDDVKASSQQDFTMGNEFPDGYLVLDEGVIVSGEDAFKSAKQFDADVNKAMNGAYEPEKAPAQQAQYNSALSM